jgi:hypothetical protein
MVEGHGVSGICLNLDSVGPSVSGGLDVLKHAVQGSSMVAGDFSDDQGRAIEIRRT